MERRVGVVLWVAGRLPLLAALLILIGLPYRPMTSNVVCCVPQRKTLVGLIIFAILVFGALPENSAFAQTQTATLAGAVRDSGGSILLTVLLPAPSPGLARALSASLSDLVQDSTGARMPSLLVVLTASPTFALGWYFRSWRRRIPFAFNAGSAKIGENGLGEDLASFRR
jgi:hypothetical protein